MTEELKPCPFCSTSGEERLYELSSRFDGGHIAHIHCTHCGCDGPSKYSGADEHAAIRDAAAAWNRRAAAALAGTATGEKP